MDAEERGAARATAAVAVGAAGTKSASVGHAVAERADWVGDDTCTRLKDHVCEAAVFVALVVHDVLFDLTVDSELVEHGVGDERAVYGRHRRCHHANKKVVHHLVSTSRVTIFSTGSVLSTGTCRQGVHIILQVQGQVQSCRCAPALQWPSPTPCADEYRLIAQISPPSRPRGRHTLSTSTSLRRGRLSCSSRDPLTRAGP